MQTQFEEARPEQQFVRAARFHKVGIPLSIERVPKPNVGAGEALLKVGAAGICHTDLHMIDGKIPAKPPVTLGHEFAGEIAELGPGVSQLKEGNRVVVHFPSHCGNCRYCLEGRGTHCENLFTRPIYGGFVDGGYAEYCKVNMDRLVHVPRDVPIEFAATLGCAGLTAYHAVRAVARVSLGDNVGIYGVGGVGMYALQIAKLSGARVVAIGRNPEKLKMAEDLGADHIVNASGANLEDEVKKATDGKGVDVMLDFVVGSESVKKSSNTVSNGGRIVLVGLSNEPLSIDPLAFGIRELSMAGSLMGTKKELEDVVELARTEKLRSIATRRFALDQVNEGLSSLRRGEILGRGYVVP